ncbi:DUF7311 family protein [Halorarum halobium]|uniref:DUF7311 family protein n=1 Tax=Halorarum halobium TaxID=3075121 RepID=UPI0028AE1FCA|nr:hypothetical protein [Halobaculum sp. XH14]
MIRYVLATVLAVALLGVSLPPIQAAGAERTASTLDRFGERLDRAAAELRSESDPVGATLPGGREVVELSLPRASLTAAPVRFVELCTLADGRTALRYGVGSGSVVTRWLDAGLRLPDGPIRFVEAGAHRVELRFTRLEGVPVVAATTPESSNTGTEPTAACDSSTDSDRATHGPASVDRPSGPRPVRATLE